MIDTRNLFDLTQLSEASYANLPPGNDLRIERTKGTGVDFFLNP